VLRKRGHAVAHQGHKTTKVAVLRLTIVEARGVPERAIAVYSIIIHLPTWVEVGIDVEDPPPSLAR